MTFPALGPTNSERYSRRHRVSKSMSSIDLPAGPVLSHNQRLGRFLVPKSRGGKYNLRPIYDEKEFGSDSFKFMEFEPSIPTLPFEAKAPSTQPAASIFTSLLDPGLSVYDKIPSLIGSNTLPVLLSSNHFSATSSLYPVLPSSLNHENSSQRRASMTSRPNALLSRPDDDEIVCAEAIIAASLSDKGEDQVTPDLTSSFLSSAPGLGTEMPLGTLDLSGLPHGLPMQAHELRVIISPNMEKSIPRLDDPPLGTVLQEHMGSCLSWSPARSASMEPAPSIHIHASAEEDGSIDRQATRPGNDEESGVHHSHRGEETPAILHTASSKNPHANTHTIIPIVSITEPSVSHSGSPSSKKTAVVGSADSNDIANPKRRRSGPLATNSNTRKGKFGLESRIEGFRNRVRRAVSTGSIPIPRDIDSDDGGRDSLATSKNASVNNRRPDLNCHETDPATTTNDPLLQRQRSPSSTPSFDSIPPSNDLLNAFEIPIAGGNVFQDTPKSKKKVKTPSNIDDEIQEYIRRPLTSKRVEELRNGTKGRIYINKNHQNLPGQVYKIGKTGKSTHTRRGKQEIKCGDSLEECSFSDCVPIVHSAEHLSQLQLEFFNRPYAHPTGGKCSTKHKEYYEVEEGIAKAVVEVWAAFCEHIPYDRDGELKSFWADRLSSMEKFPTHQTHHDHDAQIRRWRSFVYLGFWDLVWHDFSEAQCHFFRLKHDTCFWKCISVVLVLVEAVEYLLGQIAPLLFRIGLPLGVACVYICYTLLPKVKILRFGKRLFWFLDSCSEFMECRQEAGAEGST